MFNERLNFTRKYRGFTAQQMADKLGYSLDTFRKYESAKRSPNLDTLVVIANILDVPTDFLLCRDDYLKSLGVVVDVPLTSLQENPTR